MKSENNRAPHWIRQIADSLIILAAALSIIGINFKPYFEARSKIEILKMELELERMKVNPDYDRRLTHVENLAHKGGKHATQETK